MLDALISDKMMMFEDDGILTSKKAISSLSILFIYVSECEWALGHILKCMCSVAFSRIGVLETLD